MILCAVAKLLLITYAIIWATLELDTPVLFAVKWGILFLALMLDSFCRIFLFNVKQVIATTSGSTKGAGSKQQTLDATSLTQMEAEN